MIDNLMYSEQKANYKEVLFHLVECNDSFIPPLKKRLDINSYASKIIKHSITFEAWNDNVLVGLIAAYFNDIENRIGYITNVSVMSIYHGKGIASILMKNCIKYAAEKGFELIKLEVDESNLPAITLYQKFGFVQTINPNNTNAMMVKL